MKKIIALVLFAAMMLALIPAASAANAYYFKVEVLTSATAPWYGAQKPDFAADGWVGFDDDKVFATDALRYAAGGIKVVADPFKEITTATSADQTINVKLSGSFKAAEPHYYSAYANNIQTNLFGKAVKIPYQVTAIDGKILTGEKTCFLDGTGNLDYLTYVSGATETKYFYIDFPLTEADYSETYWVSYVNDTNRVKIVVTWDNIDNNTAGAAGTYPTLKVVGYVTTAAQYGNFSAEFVKQQTDNQFGNLTFSIAAKTKADRDAIYKASLTGVAKSATGTTTYVPEGVTTWDNLITFLNGINSDLDKASWSFSKPYILWHDGVSKCYLNADGDDYIIPNGLYDGTLKEWAAVILDDTANYADYQTLATAVANDTATVLMDTSIAGIEYVVDASKDIMDIRVKAWAKDGTVYPAGTIVAIGNGITFYEGGVYTWDKWLGKSTKYVDLFYEPTYLIDQDGCFVFSQLGITRFAKEAQGKYDEDITMLYKRITNNPFELVFTSGKKLETVKFHIYLQNIDRTKSAITIVGSNELTAVVGDSINLPYVLDNAFALSKDLQQGWKSVNPKVVEVTNEKTGMLKAKAVGTTYVFCTDAAGNVQLFVINVAASAPTAPTIAVPAYKTYVVTASALNVRSGPSTSFKSFGTIKRGTEVAGAEVEGSVWILVNYNGTEAYCSGKYLAEK